MAKRRRWFAGACLVTLAPGLASATAVNETMVPSAPAQPQPLSAGPLRAECEAPRTIRLRRFEDGSAQLFCAGRVLVRVSVPR